ncbi:MAG: DUF3172 domain-containing protein [Spirulinaceae cyanobacterium SM2_1_0]|nr:DUF3172 domain-containing protein [Spirulinaceae cyanobacterium SM2_1_0]
MPRKPKPPYERPPYESRYDRDFDRPVNGRSPAANKSGKPPWLSVNYLTLAIMGAILVIGIVIGMAFSTTANNSTQNVASREVIDRSVPDPQLCQQFGASAIVSDMRVYLTLNPFNVYVTQPTMEPGCVLRRNNWSVLEKRQAVTNEQVKNCKNRMNTFGFTGKIDSASRVVDCVYQNDAAGNLFLNKPGMVGEPKETTDF